MDGKRPEDTQKMCVVRGKQVFREVGGPERESAEFQAEVRVDSKRTRTKGSF